MVSYLHMNDHQIPPHRPAPSFTPPHAPAKDMAQNGALQRPAATNAGAYRPVQVQAPSYAAAPIQPPPQPAAERPTPLPEPTVEDTSAYTVSVDDVRERLREINISKSKDTIQRYCREGDLDCRKLGLLNRYYTTTKSLEQLIETMHPVAAADGSVQVHAGADEGADSFMQVHEDAPRPESKKTPDLHTAAEKIVQPDVAADAGALSGNDTRMPVHAAADDQQSAVLQAKLDAANERIKDLKEQNEFLQEEVREGRGTRRDVTTIAEQMLGTLQTMALGGRLTPKQPTEPSVRASHSPHQADGGDGV